MSLLKHHWLITSAEAVKLHLFIQSIDIFENNNHIFIVPAPDSLAFNQKDLPSAQRKIAWQIPKLKHLRLSVSDSPSTL